MVKMIKFMFIFTTIKNKILKRKKIFYALIIFPWTSFRHLKALEIFVQIEEAMFLL